MEENNNRNKSIDNIEDIKAYQYVRFCCLLDFFEISVEELCDVYEDGTKHGRNSNNYAEKAREDYVMQNIDYFKYKLPKYNANKKALDKFIEAFIIILDDKEFESRQYTKEIMKEAKEKILIDTKYEIIYDYDVFYNFFSKLIDYVEKIDFFEDEKMKEYPRFYVTPKDEIRWKMYKMFLKDKKIFNNAIICEMLSSELKITIEDIPVPPALHCAEDIIEVLELRELLCANWDMLQKIYADSDLAKKFLEILTMKKNEEEKELLLEKALQIDGKRLLKNAKDYSYLLYFVRRRINKNKLDKFWEEDLLSTACGVFCCNHRKELMRLANKKNDAQGIFETLFYYACTRDI